MESVINHDYINSYAEAYANRIVDRYFSEHTLIDGENILSITEIRQVNLSLIKNIMIKWQAEAKKIRSPFFNYNSPEVQNALQDFMNVLSKNISIDQKTFKPLLKMAITDVLLLIFSPYEFFSAELLNIGSPVTLIELEKRKKFIKINSELYAAYLKKVESIGSDDMQIKEAKEYFDQVCADINFSPEEPDEYIALFSNEISFDIKKVYGEVEGSGSKAESLKSSSGKKEEKVTIKEEKVPIHEKFYEKKSTLVDELKKVPTSTVLDFHQKRKIESIKKNISIQQRFRFVRELFDEKAEMFTETIDYLDHCQTYNEATDYLNDKFLNTGKWNGENDVVTEFLSVVKKKFPD
jgi:hypothetical protein